MNSSTLARRSGNIPFLANRLTYGPTIGSYLPERDVLGALRRLHFDIAMSTNPFTLPSLAAFADPANVLFGSDFPFMPASTTSETVTGLASSPVWTDAEKAAIGRDNALRLLPRLAARLSYYARSS